MMGSEGISIYMWRTQSNEARVCGLLGYMSFQMKLSTQYVSVCSRRIVSY